MDDPQVQPRGIVADFINNLVHPMTIPADRRRVNVAKSAMAPA